MLSVTSQVLFSSVAALLGSAGQANYSAANGALDGLAALWAAQVSLSSWHARTWHSSSTVVLPVLSVCVLLGDSHDESGFKIMHATCKHLQAT